MSENNNDMAQTFRAGKFGISTEAVMVNTEQVAQMLALLQFVPARVEHLPMRHQFLYEGTSPSFESIKYGETLPEYLVVMTQEDDGTISSVNVTRVVPPAEL